MRRQISLILLTLLIFILNCSAQITPPTAVAQWPQQSRDTIYIFTIDGNRAYIPTTSGPIVVDVSDPAHMRVLSMLDNHGGLVVPLLPGKFILHDFVPGPPLPSTVQVLNVEDVLDPVSLWSGPGFWSAASWPYVYWTSPTAPQIVISDFTDPAHPVEVGAAAIYSVGLFTHQNVLVSHNADKQTQYDFFDITDRATPKPSGSTSTNLYVSQIAFDGNYAYACGTTRLIEQKVHVIDISNPSQVQTVGEWILDSRNQLMRITAADGIAVVDVAYLGLKVLDVSDPAHPYDIALFRTEQNVPGVHWLKLVGHRLFVTTDFDLTCYDLTNPRDPTLLGSIRLGGSAWNLKKNGNRLFVQQSHEGVQILDVTNPAQPRPIPSGLPEALALDVVATNVYLIDHDFNFKIFAITDQAPAQMLSTLPLGATSRAIAVAGNLAFVEVANSVRIIDISQPSAPTVVTNVGAPFTNQNNGSIGLVHANNLIYSYGEDPTNSAAGLLRIFDVQTGELLSSTKTEFLQGFGLIGSLVYINPSIYDCSNPRNPVLAGHLPVPIYSTAALGPDNKVYAGDKVFDVSDPLSPQLVYTSPRTFGMCHLVDGDFLYTTDYGYVTIFQIAGEVPTIPSLNVVPYGETHHVSWPTRFQNVQLLTAPSAIGPWTLSLRPAMTNYHSYDYEVFIPSRGPGAFYRLQKAQ